MTKADEVRATFAAAIAGLQAAIADPQTGTDARNAAQAAADALSGARRKDIGKGFAARGAALHTLVAHLRRAAGVRGDVVAEACAGLAQILARAEAQLAAAGAEALAPDAEAIAVAAVPVGAAAGVPESWRAEYEARFGGCFIRPANAQQVRALVAKMKQNRARYEDAGAGIGMPWWFIACVHAMESGFNFQRHLHNGDPLTARTVQVPAGRPKAGTPPFTWEQSARDALHYKGLDKWTDWSIAGALYQLERYNGLGYRKLKKLLASPYLWSFTNHYAKGKFVADGKFDAEAVSKQCGAAAALCQFANDGEIAV